MTARFAWLLAVATLVLVLAVASKPIPPPVVHIHPVPAQLVNQDRASVPVTATPPAAVTTTTTSSTVVRSTTPTGTVPTALNTSPRPLITSLGAPTSGCWARIIARESHGNPQAVNLSTGAGGLFQFLPSSFRAYGGTGRPQDATPAEQWRIAMAAYARSGYQPWGGCPR